MQKVIQTIALLAAFLTLCAGLWQGWSFPVTMKKLVFSYMGIFLTGAFMVLAIRLVGELEPHASAKAEEPEKNKRKRS